MIPLTELSLQGASRKKIGEVGRKNLQHRWVKESFRSSLLRELNCMPNGLAIEERTVLPAT